MWLLSVIPVATIVAFFPSFARADGPTDNLPDRVRAVPPAGTQVPATDAKALQAGLSTLAQKIEVLKTKTPLPARLPDVEIYYRAVSSALKNDEFFAACDINRAKSHLQTGLDRAASLAQGQTPWLEKPGPVALGYVSKIDGSIQPYGGLDSARLDTHVALAMAAGHVVSRSR